MRRCGAEKLPWLVVEVEVDAERAGCFAERQVRLGLVVDEAIPETRDRLGSPPARGSRDTNERASESQFMVSAALRRSPRPRRQTHPSTRA